MMAQIISADISEPEIIAQSILFCREWTDPPHSTKWHPLRRASMQVVVWHCVVPPKCAHRNSSHHISMACCAASLPVRMQSESPIPE